MGDEICITRREQGPVSTILTSAAVHASMNAKLANEARNLDTPRRVPKMWRVCFVALLEAGATPFFATLSASIAAFSERISPK
ncbi:MAG: hypothetical protein EAZ24_01895 [Burkholderiales bacterium]|nr:MAG: hypothetical protein EAZ21_13355 [Betaproteobacteria bacterium]TAG84143.1 MAG: hypothetical protein EAZ24_01895 [Burkholderiales bacterium]